MAHALGLSGATLIPWSVYQHKFGGLPPVHVDYPGMAAGHYLRDHPVHQKPVTEYHCDILILGSGAAALTAAWQLKKQGKTGFVMLEGPEPNGNNAGGYDRELSFPTGAHYLSLPSEQSSHVRELLSDLGILKQNMDQARPAYDERLLTNAPEERLLYQGQWLSDLLPAQDQDSIRFFKLVHQLGRSTGQDKQPLFAIPVALSSQDAQWRQLDQLTFRQWLDQNNYHSATLRWYLNYCCRDDYGQGIDQVSAWAGLHYFASRVQAQSEHASYLVWPDGLAGLSNKIRAYINFQGTNIRAFQSQPIPQAMAGFATKIIERPDYVEVWTASYHDQQVHTACFKARQVICAMPLYMAARLVKNIQQYGFDPSQHLPAYAPWLVSNFTLKQYPEELKNEPLAWDNVVYQGKGLGYVVATHQWIRVAKPPRTVFTAYTALDFDQPDKVRYWLRHASKKELLEKASEDLLQVYGKRFWQCVERVNITVRGHAMATPLPRRFKNSGLLALQQHRSRLLFAHADLSGYSIFEEAAWWGYQAAKHIIEQDLG